MRLLPPDEKRFAALASHIRELPPGEPMPRSWVRAAFDMVWKRVVPDKDTTERREQP